MHDGDGDGGASPGRTNVYMLLPEISRVCDYDGLDYHHHDAHSVGFWIDAAPLGRLAGHVNERCDDVYDVCSALLLLFFLSPTQHHVCVVHIVMVSGRVRK